MVGYQKSLAISLILHVCLIVSMYGFIHDSHVVGKQSYKVLHAVVLFDELDQKIQQKDIKKTKSVQPVKKVKNGLIKKNVVKNIQQSNVYHAIFKARQSAHLTKGERDILLAALHDAVAKHLIYPASASFLNLQGSVKLGFDLAPNGVISNIHIVSSSHVKALDYAALQTIQSISPFLLAERYLKARVYFSLTVEFVL